MMQGGSMMHLNNRSLKMDSVKPTEATIVIKPKGPYVVTGAFTVTDEKGNKVQTKEKVSLCRCGASTTKPFCDGTHSKIGFEAAAAAVPESKE